MKEQKNQRVSEENNQKTETKTKPKTTAITNIDSSNFFSRTYLPFEHSVFLKRFLFIDVCVASNQWVLSI